MKALALASLLTFVAPLPAVAQPSVGGPLDRLGLEPVLVLFYADTLGLTKEQRASVELQFREAKKRYQTLSLDLSRETSKLAELVGNSAAAETAVMAQLDRVLDIERQIKHSNLVCAVRVRRHLTSAQVERLEGLEVPPPPPPPPPPGAARRPSPSTP